MNCNTTHYRANSSSVPGDPTCALFDANGQLLAQAAHIPVHLGSMPASVASVRAVLGELAEGDVAIVNDPFAGGTHLPDITIVSPIHADDAASPTGRSIVGYAANRAHHADVGGTSPGSMTLSRHIDEEGLRLEPMLLYRAGQPVPAVMQRILSSVRTPAERIGDLEAQLAANVVGTRSLQRMIATRGREKVLTYGLALQDYSAAFMAKAIAGIPDGVYHFQDVMDGDGVTIQPIAIDLVLTIQGDRAIADFRQSAGQVAGCINCPEAVTKSAVYYCFCCLLDVGVPLNAGAFRNIQVQTKSGSVVHAVHPAAVVAGNTETSQRVVDVVFGALAQAIPDRIPAASCGTMNSVALGGAATADRPAWTYYETIGGGSGASPAGDGASAVQCHMTNTLNTPAEAIELQYLLRVRRFERAAGTGGAGKYQGGDGIVREIEALAPCEGTLLADRRVGQPYGLDGGESGSAGHDEVIRTDGSNLSLQGKSRFTLQTHEVLRIRTPGGGGWG